MLLSLKHAKLMHLTCKTSKLPPFSHNYLIEVW